MNTWLIGHVPIGHHQIEYPKTTTLSSGLTEQGAKTFFLKARIRRRSRGPTGGASRTCWQNGDCNASPFQILDAPKLCIYMHYVRNVGGPISCIIIVQCLPYMFRSGK
jgi:hypothetical protein